MSEFGDSPVAKDTILGLKILATLRTAGIDAEKMQDSDFFALSGVLRMCMGDKSVEDMSDEEIEELGKRFSNLMLNVEEHGNEQLSGDFSVEGDYESKSVIIGVPESPVKYGIDCETAAEIGFAMVNAAITVSEANNININLKVPRLVVERVARGAVPAKVIDGEAEKDMAVVAREGDIYMHWRGDWVKVHLGTAKALAAALLAQVKMARNQPNPDTTLH